MSELIMSQECWLKERCFKYKNNEDAECRSGNVFCIKLFKIDTLCKEALLSDTQRERIKLYADDVDIDKFQRLTEIEKQIKQYIENGNNLFIYSSNVGNGKTSWAVRLAQSYINAIWTRTDIRCRALFINVPKFFLALKDSISNQNDYIQHIKENVLTADLVVWDEIGTKSLTSFEFENLLSLVDNRVTSGKANIYTSNLYGETLRNNIGDRLYSRIVNLSETIELRGRDRRGVHKNDYSVAGIK